MDVPSPLVSTEWLASRLDDAGLKIVDASWHLPTADRNARAEFAAEHIPGAQFFDIDGISMPGTNLPHMAASPEIFAGAVGQLGISEKDAIVVYDSAGLFSAARAWWNFRIMGAPKTFVLDGGLPKWKAEGRPLASGTHAPHPATFAAAPIPDAIATSEQVNKCLKDDVTQIVDVRPAARFRGEAAEPRPGLRSGHMPGALNLPFSALVENGRLADVASLRRAITQAGIELDRPVISSCGSGVTAPLLNLALAQLGVEALTVYDGSWAEWGGRDDLPVVKGA